MIGFDRDPEAMAAAKARLEEVEAELGEEMPEVVYVAKAFSEAASEIEPGSLDGLLADFGVSSLQLDEAHRGFSFRSDGPLDMRHGYAQWGDGRASGKSGRRKRARRPDLRIRRGKEVAENRQSHCEGPADTTTAELAQIISAAAPSMKGDKIHPATRTFQALRIRVNNELGEIQSLLKSAGSLLKPGGRLVLISFHSLEDRLVKDAFREAAKDAKMFEVLTKKPVVAGEQEEMRNPRSRSAKMRAAEKV